MSEIFDMVNRFRYNQSIKTSQNKKLVDLKKIYMTKYENIKIYLNKIT